MLSALQNPARAASARYDNARGSRMSVCKSHKIQEGAACLRVRHKMEVATSSSSS